MKMIIFLSSHNGVTKHLYSMSIQVAISGWWEKRGERMRGGYQKALLIFLKCLGSSSYYFLKLCVCAFVCMFYLDNKNERLKTIQNFIFKKLYLFYQ